MRKTILTTAAIAFVALGTAFGVVKSEEIKSFFASKNLYSHEQAQTAPASDAATTTADTSAAPAATEDATLNNQTPAAGEETKAEEAVAPAADATVAAPVTTEAATTAATEETAAAPAAASETKFVVDVPRALKDRSVGSPDAPLTVYDFSSLTCPHCAFFHTEIFPKIKANYIDTGKVRWVFRGFPLNEPALKGEMIARCAPEDQYEKLIDLMFKNQDRWAFTSDPLPNLNMLLRLAGISDDMFQACTTNKDLETGLATAAQTAGDKYKISSTPTFIFNDGVKNFSGAGTYEGFALDLDQTLKALTTPAMSTSDKLESADDKAAAPSENPLAPKQ